MAAVESGARKLTPEDADDLRGRVRGILRRAKVPRSNLTKEQRTALKELRGLEDEVILPADKGNATVMMRTYGEVLSILGHFTNCVNCSKCE